jgi:hypothetical protein
MFLIFFFSFRFIIAIPGCCVANGDCPDSLTNPCDIPTCTNQVCGFVKDPDCCTTNADCAAVGVCERQCETNPLAPDFGHCIPVLAGCCNVATDCIAPDVGGPLVRQKKKQKVKEN